MKLSDPKRLKYILYFLQKKLFLYFEKRNFIVPNILEENFPCLKNKINKKNSLQKHLEEMGKIWEMELCNLKF